MSMALLRAARRALGPACLAVAAACADDRPDPVSAPSASAPDLTGQAFRLTIDTRSGHIDVATPAPAASAYGPRLSLLGREAIGLSAGDCVFSPVPSNSKLKRCTFNLAITNKLAGADLVTPATFPTPPAGTNGLLVFPYTSAALGISGGVATPTKDWDYGPINLFNDIGGCVNSKTSDCYRYELYPSPLYASDHTPPRAVGFDVDKAAQSVTAYIVVAADLGQTVTLKDEGHCGSSIHDDLGDYLIEFKAVITGRFYVVHLRAFCSFDLGALPGARVAAATLRLYQQAVVKDVGPGAEPYDFGPVIVDRLAWSGSVTPSAEDMYTRSGVVTLLEPNIGILSDDATIGVYKTLDVTAAVADDAASGRGASRFGIHFQGDATASPNGEAIFSTSVVDPAHPAELVLTYTTP